MSESAEYLKFQTNRQVKRLFKGFIVTIEDMRIRGQISEEDYGLYRKRILDSGNECIREIEQDIDKVIL
jgi:hypothetical protein